MLSQFQSGPPVQSPSITEKQEIICWNPGCKEKTYTAKAEFEKAFELENETEGIVADVELIWNGYLPICGMVYFLSNRGLSAQFL